jgi:hypothetical protein
MEAFNVTEDVAMKDQLVLIDTITQEETILTLPNDGGLWADCLYSVWDMRSITERNETLMLKNGDLSFQKLLRALKTGRELVYLTTYTSGRTDHVTRSYIRRIKG